jgi:hypothetical protein
MKTNNFLNFDSEIAFYVIIQALKNKKKSLKKKHIVI